MSVSDLTVYSSPEGRIVQVLAPHFVMYRAIWISRGLPKSRLFENQRSSSLALASAIRFLKKRKDKTRQP